MGVFQNHLMGAAAAAASAGGGAFYGYQIEQSCRFDRANSDYLHWSPSSSPSSNKIFTLSCWVKRCNLGNAVETIISADDSSSGQYNVLVFQSGTVEKLTFQLAGGGANTYLATNNSFRDTSGWNHIVWRVDTTDATSGNRNRLYLNGELQTTGDGTQPSQDATLDWNSNAEQQFVGIFGDGSSHAFDGYLAEVINCDGQSYAPSQFGETKNGVWIPKNPSGTTFGTNGFHLKFENASDLGNDSSGNNNDLTTSMGTDHQVLDSPTFGD